MPLAEFPRAGWCWPNFRPEEPACKDGSILIHPPTVDKLQRLRDRLGAPLVVNSAFRSPGYNKRIGGAAGSMHLAARAYDIRMAGHDPHQFEAAARKAGFTGFGLGAQTDIPIPASRMIRPPARIMLRQHRLARCALNPHKRGENPCRAGSGCRHQPMQKPGIRSRLTGTRITPIFNWLKSSNHGRTPSAETVTNRRAIPTENLYVS
ncbi:D-Ala-D-Ala carboxypeptidase family metallohydrolase [Paracoccus simplex]|uniref:D-Ala-D-Ala carboxypeptidase family metallohydrolase n=1 Tax=Paracoccus simplex TaxID=2086346 RepID=A0ABV7RYY1_9RHOB